jgi:hypothetical protein
MWMGVDLLFGPIEIEKKREGNPRIALGAVGRFCVKAGATGKKREGDRLSITVTLN